MFSHHQAPLEQRLAEHLAAVQQMAAPRLDCNSLALAAEKIGAGSGINTFKFVRNPKKMVSNEEPHAPDLERVQQHEPSTIKEGVSFVTLGCNGTGDAGQEEVARALGQYIAKIKRRFIGILSGDSCYSSGIFAPNDSKMESAFFKKYPFNPDAPDLAEMIFFAAAGNHDLNYHKTKIPGAASGIQHLRNLIALTFLHPKTKEFNALFSMRYNHVTDEDRARGYIEIDPDELAESGMFWNMPRRFYSLIDDDVEIFFIDSSNYAAEYLEYCRATSKGDVIDMTQNQCAWLPDALKRSTARIKILVSHHSMNTIGSRAYTNEQHIYLEITLIDELTVRLNLSEEQIKILAKSPYNYLLSLILAHQDIICEDKMIIDAVLSAHDHNMSYICNLDIPRAPLNRIQNDNNNVRLPEKNYQLCQIVSGSGNSKLQDRKKYSTEGVGCFMKQPGFVIVDARNDSAAKLHFTFTTADGKSTQLFSNLSHRAIINYPHFKQDAERAKVFIEIIQEATQQYLKDFIGNKQDEKEGMFLLFNFTHGEKDILRAHEVFNYINNHTPRAASFQDLVEDIYQLTKWTGIRKKSSDNSLITKIDALMLEKLASTMRDYRNEVKDPRVKGERGIKLV